MSTGLSLCTQKQEKSEMTATLPEKIEMTTKSGMSFTVSFSSDAPDYDRLAKFFLLLSEKPKTDKK